MLIIWTKHTFNRGKKKKNLGTTSPFIETLKNRLINLNVYYERILESTMGVSGDKNDINISNLKQFKI